MDGYETAAAADRQDEGKGKIFCFLIGKWDILGSKGGTFDEIRNTM
jgi:hypothetical protein